MGDDNTLPREVKAGRDVYQDHLVWVRDLVKIQRKKILPSYLYDAWLDATP